MPDFADKCLVVFNNTVVKYEGRDANLDFETCREFQNVTKIGDGAFMECPHLVNVDLSDTVTHIGINAFKKCENLYHVSLYAGFNSTLGRDSFRGCKQLSNIVLKRVRIKKEVFVTLCGKSATVDGVCFATGSFPEGLLPEGVKFAWEPSAPTYFPTHAKYIFCEQNDDKEDKVNSLKDCIELSRNVLKRRELDVVTDLIKKNEPFPIPDKVEKLIDLNIRKNEKASLERTVLYSFIDDTEPAGTGEAFINLQIHLGFFFVPVVRHIRMDGTDYFLYRRLYFSSRVNAPLVPVDVAIFKGTTIVMDREEAMRVYAKSRLCEIL